MFQNMFHTKKTPHLCLAYWRNINLSVPVGAGAVSYTHLDLIHISNELNISKKEFIHKYCEKDDIQCEGYVINIYILKNINNQCVFLSRCV